MKIIKTLILLYLLPTLLFSALLYDVPVELKQPDGSTLHCYASGDEYYSRLHDQNDYTITQSNEDGFYYYALLENQTIVPSIYRADQNYNLAQLGFRKKVMIPQERYLEIRERWWNGVETRDAPTTGTVNNLNVFIRFADEDEFGNARSYYDSYFNNENGPSMKHYFSEVSYDMLTVNTIHYPTSSMDSNLSYQDQYPRSYYQPYNAVTNPGGYTDSERTDREHTLLQNAIAFIESEVPDSLIIDSNNDGNVDNVTFLVYGVPGGWADLLWPHRWALYSVVSEIHGKRVWDYNFNMASGPYFSVGTLAHEFCHSLGAPDLYHYYNDTAPVAVGGWDVMDASTDIPQWMSSYIKYRYFNWIELQDASGGGTFELNPLGQPDNNAYRLDSSNPNEYFIIEYRTQEGMYDSNAPGIDSGIVIYRVNDLYNGQGNAQGPPDELYVYRVGGTSTTSGVFASAVFSEEVGRTQFNDSTNPSCFLSDESMGGVNIVDIGSAGDTIEFTVLNLMLLGDYVGISSDSDGDGILNPGESVVLEFVMNNMSDDVTAYGITGQLSSDYGISFPSSTIEFGELDGGQSSFSNFIEVTLSEDIQLGQIPIELEITAEYIQGNDLLFYNDSYTFMLDVSLNQSGFPNETSFPISSSPIMINIDNDNDKEIIIADYDGKVRAYNTDGSVVEDSVYPYQTENQIWGSIASADIDLDEVMDYVVGCKDKHLYLFNELGYIDRYDTDTFLLGTPAIGNIDNDPELEIIIAGYSGGDGRKIIALNHDMTLVSGYPMFIGEKIKKGISLADFNGNGKDDLVFGTDDDNIYLIYDDGTVADGFPYQTGDKIHSSPSILNYEGEHIIIAGSNDNHLYGINSDGSLRFMVEASDNIETSPSFVNYLNNCYIIFGDSDGYLYAVNQDGQMYPYFPIDLGSQIAESVVVSDLNSDSIPDLFFGTQDGKMYAMSITGGLYNQFPINYPFAYRSAPLIYDLDSDNDLEVIAGTSLSLNVFDIKQSGTTDDYWSMYKGNYRRTGYNEFNALCVLGDLNVDGAIDVIDILQQINFILGTFEPNLQQLCASDLNADGTIDLLDVVLLIQIVLNQV